MEFPARSSARHVRKDRPCPAIAGRQRATVVTARIVHANGNGSLLTFELETAEIIPAKPHHTQSVGREEDWVELASWKSVTPVRTDDGPQLKSSRSTTARRRNRFTMSKSNGHHVYQLGDVGCWWHNAGPGKYSKKFSYFGKNRKKAWTKARSNKKRRKHCSWSKVEFTMRAR